MADVTIKVAADDEGATELIGALRTQLDEMGAASTVANSAFAKAPTALNAAAAAAHNVGAEAQKAGINLEGVHARVDRTEFRQARALDAIVLSLGGIVQGGASAGKAISGLGSGLQILSITLPHLFALAAAFSLVTAGIEAITKAREDDAKASEAEEKRHQEAIKSTVARSRAQADQLRVDRAAADQLENRAQAQQQIVARLIVERLRLEKQMQRELVTTGATDDATYVKSRENNEKLIEAEESLIDHRRAASEANSRVIESQRTALANLIDEQNRAALHAGLTQPASAAVAIAELGGSPGQQQTAFANAATVIFENRKKQLEDEIRTRNLLGAALERQTALNQGLSVAQANELASLAGGAAFAARLKELQDEAALIGLTGTALERERAIRQGMSDIQATTVARLRDENAARTKELTLIRQYSNETKAAERALDTLEKHRQQNIATIIEDLRRENRERTQNITTRTVQKLNALSASGEEIDAALRQIEVQERLAEATARVSQVMTDTQNLQLTLTARLDELQHQRDQGMINERTHVQLTRETYQHFLDEIDQQIAKLEESYRVLAAAGSPEAAQAATEIGRLQNEAAILTKTLQDFKSENELLANRAADAWRSGMESIITNVLTTGEHIHAFFRTLLLDVTNLIRQIIAQYAAARFVRAILGAAGTGTAPGVPSGIAGEGAAGGVGILSSLQTALPPTIAVPSFAAPSRNLQIGTNGQVMQANITFEHHTLDPRNNKQIMQGYEPVIRQMVLRVFRESRAFTSGAQGG